MSMGVVSWLVALAVVALVVMGLLSSIKTIGPTEVGLVTKRFGLGKLGDDNPIAFQGEAGYQAKLLMPGLRFKLWPIFGVKKFPWVQVPAGEIGVVIAQVGAPLPIGAKSGVYKPEFGNFSTSRASSTGGGQKGVQRPVLPPGTLLPIHPVAFMVLTSRKVYGLSVSPDLVERVRGAGGADAPRDVRAHARAAPGRGDRAGRAARRGRHRHRARRRAAAARRHREPARWLRRHRGDGASRRTPSTRRSSRCCSAARTRCTTTTRTSRRSSTPAARSVCNTTRCCTARTC